VSLLKAADSVTKEFQKAANTKNLLFSKAARSYEENCEK
jgi:hypothetical protein